MTPDAPEPESAVSGDERATIRQRRELSRISRERAERKAVELLGDMNHGMIRDMMLEAKDRKDYARVAANITEDRYGASSTAAMCAIVILLQHGVEMATDFVKDLEYHES